MDDTGKFAANDARCSGELQARATILAIPQESIENPDDQKSADQRKQQGHESPLLAILQEPLCEGENPNGKRYDIPEQHKTECRDQPLLVGRLNRAALPLRPPKPRLLRIVVA